MNLNNYLLIFFGGGLGCLARYLISNGIYSLVGQNFPYGTLIVNVTGSFLMGFLFIIILERIGEIAPALRMLLLVGFLGGYTTFSSFSIETFNLLEQGAMLKALLNIGISVISCITAVWFGVVLGRSL